MVKASKEPKRLGQPGFPMKKGNMVVIVNYCDWNTLKANMSSESLQQTVVSGMEVVLTPR